MHEHGSVLLYVYGNHEACQDGQSKTATSTLTQLLNYVVVHGLLGLFRVGARGQAAMHSLFPPSPLPPSLIIHLASVDVKQHV